MTYILTNESDITSTSDKLETISNKTRQHIESDSEGGLYLELEVRPRKRKQSSSRFTSGKLFNSFYVTS